MTATQAERDKPKKIQTAVKDQKSKQRVIRKGQTAPMFHIVYAREYEHSNMINTKEQSSSGHQESINLGVVGDSSGHNAATSVEEPDERNKES